MLHCMDLILLLILKKRKKSLLRFCQDNKLLGTFLIANEGINGTVSGQPDNIDNVIKFIKNWNEIKNKKNKINVSDEIYNYVLEIEKIIQSLDQQIYISPRCLKQIIDLGRGWAMIHSKSYVTHQDIKDLLPYVLKHRIKFLKQEEKKDFVISEILNKISIQK